MSKWNQDALVALQGKLKENLTMTQLCDMLEKPAGGFMSHAEAIRVTELSGDSKQIEQIIKILRGKDDRDFATFCEMLRRSNYGVWANKLELKAGTVKNGQGKVIAYCSLFCGVQLASRDKQCMQCVCVCVRACVHTCVRVRVRVCVVCLCVCVVCVYVHQMPH